MIRRVSCHGYLSNQIYDAGADTLFLFGECN